MEIINSRYKITGKINNTISHVQEFSAVDLWSKNTKINLKVVSSLDLSKEELAFFKDNFITINSIDNYFHLKNYGFARLFLTYPSLPPSSPDEILYIYLCTDLIQGETEFDENEAIDLEEHHINDLFEMTVSGKIIDAKTQIGIFMVKALIDKGELADYLI